MVLLATLGTMTQDNNMIAHGNADRELPAFVEAMLRNVHLSYDDETHIFEQEGDFWYWKLTDYGCALMRLFVRSDASGFSYAVTFTEPEIENIPQLILLTEVNQRLYDKLKHPASDSHWNAVLDDSPYLRGKDAVIDLEFFQYEVDGLIERLKEGIYDYSGYRDYTLRP